MPDKGDCALNVVFMGILEGKRLNARAGGMRKRKRAPIVFMREQILQRGVRTRMPGAKQQDKQQCGNALVRIEFGLWASPWEAHCTALWIIGLPLWPSLSSALVGNKHRIIACEQKEQGATVERFSHRRIAMVPSTSDQRRVSSWLNCRWAVSKDCQLSTTDFVRHNANAGTVTRPVVQLMTLIQASTSLTCEAVLGLGRST